MITNQDPNNLKSVVYAGGYKADGNDLNHQNLFFDPQFADSLRGRLAREAGQGAAALLHRQASVWFGRQGLLPQAIGHALAADAVDDAATWIEALLPAMFATMGIHQALADWLSALPEPVVRSRPLLCLAQPWLLIHRVELETAAGWVEAAAQALPASHAQ